MYARHALCRQGKARATLRRLSSTVRPSSENILNYIDYNTVAELYDVYAAEKYDHKFFLNRIRAGMRVLELMSGTGRLSIPLIKAGAILSCVDISQRMVNVLQSKLRAEKLQAKVLCADVQHLDYSSEFEIVILPFQSFMELVGKTKQLNALRSAYQALVPNGLFFCTMHNPAVRRKLVDGVEHKVGKFPCKQGYIVVTGIETGGFPVVQRIQFIDRYNNNGHLEERIKQPMQFEMIEKDQFRELAIEAGFLIRAVYGDYDANEFDEETSPVMIWELEKCEV